MFVKKININEGTQNLFVYSYDLLLMFFNTIFLNCFIIF